jgi:C4-dicarboxylate-specific signal transduction histidine kinase
MTPLRDHGHQGYARIARDLTERRQGEEALRLAHEELEQRVIERTAELREVNQELSREISERKHAEQVSREAQAELARMARVTAMWELAASIAHEVNQPLAAIVTNANACVHWLNRTPPDLGEARAATARIVKEGHRAGEVIERIRSLAKQSPPRMVSLGVNELISEGILLTRHEILRHGVTWRTELASDLPAIMGDPVQLQQVIVNLIVNALEAISAKDEGPRELWLGSRRQGDEVIVMVRDSGAGIDPGIADRLFKPFFTTKDAGMGLGLSISRSIIEAHGGRLWVVTNEESGATFEFALPANS